MTKQVGSYAGVTCSSEGCDKQARKSGLCVNHYQRLPRTKAKRQQTKLSKLETLMGRARPDYCEACGKEPRLSLVLAYDHCHLTETARGWLCTPCNLTLGMMEEDAAALEALARYIRSKQ